MRNLVHSLGWVSRKSLRWVSREKNILLFLSRLKQKCSKMLKNSVSKFPNAEEILIPLNTDKSAT